MPLVSRQHERRETVRGIDVRPGCQQSFDDVLAAVLGRVVQGRAAVDVSGGEIRAAGQEEFHELQVSLLDGKVQGGGALDVPGIDIGAAGQQQGGNVLVTAVGGPVQGGLAPGGGGTGRNALGQRGPDAIEVAGLGRLVQLPEQAEGLSFLDGRLGCCGAPVRHVGGPCGAGCQQGDQPYPGECARLQGVFLLTQRVGILPKVERQAKTGLPGRSGTVCPKPGGVEGSHQTRSHGGRRGKSTRAPPVLRVSVPAWFMARSSSRAYACGRTGDTPAAASGPGEDAPQDGQDAQDRPPEAAIYQRGSWKCTSRSAPLAFRTIRAAMTAARIATTSRAILAAL